MASEPRSGQPQQQFTNTASFYTAPASGQGGGLPGGSKTAPAPEGMRDQSLSRSSPLPPIPNLNIDMTGAGRMNNGHMGDSVRQSVTQQRYDGMQAYRETLTPEQQKLYDDARRITVQGGSRSRSGGNAYDTFYGMSPQTMMYQPAQTGMPSSPQQQQPGTVTYPSPFGGTMSGPVQRPGDPVPYELQEYMRDLAAQNQQQQQQGGGGFMGQIGNMIGGAVAGGANMAAGGMLNGGGSRPQQQPRPNPGGGGGGSPQQSYNTPTMFGQFPAGYAQAMQAAMQGSQNSAMQNAVGMASQSQVGGGLQSVSNQGMGGVNNQASNQLWQAQQNQMPHATGGNRGMAVTDFYTDANGNRVMHNPFDPVTPDIANQLMGNTGINQATINRMAATGQALPTGGGGGGGAGGGAGGGGGGAAGGGGGGASGTGNSQADQLAQWYQDAYNEGRNTNLQRYEELRGLHDARIDRNMERVQGLGAQAQADINRNYRNLDSSVQSDLINRGLSNSTRRATARTGVERERNADTARLQEQLRREQIGLDTQLSGDKLAFMERREDTYPDLNQLIDLMRQFGASGFGQTPYQGQNGYNFPPINWPQGLPPMGRPQLANFQVPQQGQQQVQGGGGNDALVGGPGGGGSRPPGGSAWVGSLPGGSGGSMLPGGNAIPNALAYYYQQPIAQYGAQGAANFAQGNIPWGQTGDALWNGIGNAGSAIGNGLNWLGEGYGMATGATSSSNGGWQNWLNGIFG